MKALADDSPALHHRCADKRIGMRLRDALAG
jgi:hypothetical protein